jgi:hypothetical protein
VQMDLRFIEVVTKDRGAFQVRPGQATPTVHGRTSLNQSFLCWRHANGTIVPVAEHTRVIRLQRWRRPLPRMMITVLFGLL